MKMARNDEDLEELEEIPEMSEEDMDEDDKAYLAEQDKKFPPKQSSKIETRGRPKGTFKQPVISQRQPIQQNTVRQSLRQMQPVQPVRQAPVQAPVLQDRFGLFVQNPRVGIADNETGDIVAEGETATLQMLAKIWGKLESIEQSIGGLLTQ
jgi:hypothetical protein